MNKDLINCSICFDVFKEKVILNCNHEYCKKCIDEWIAFDNHQCPLCRKDIEYIDIYSERRKKYINNCICLSMITSLSLSFYLVLYY